MMKPFAVREAVQQQGGTVAHTSSPTTEPAGGSTGDLSRSAVALGRQNDGSRISA